MPIDITSLLGGGTTETLSGNVYPSPPVIDVTRQIIAINEDPTLTGQQKADKIAALSGISYSYVQSHPQVNYDGTLYTSTPENKNDVQNVINNLYSQLNLTPPVIVDIPNMTPIQYPSTTSVSDSGLGSPTGSDTRSLQQNNLQQSSSFSSITSSFSSIISKYGLWIIIGIAIFAFILTRPRKMEYSRRTLEAMR